MVVYTDILLLVCLFCLYLLNLPDIVCFEELGKVVILLCCLYLFYLLVNCIVISWSFNVANNAKSYREAVAVTHEGELELEGVVLTMSIMNEDVLLRNAIFTYLDNLQTKAFLSLSAQFLCAP